MFKNFFVTTFRNLSRQKVYTFLNLFGLAFGLACFILLFLYIQYETSYDKHHVNHERIYKIYQENTARGGTGYMGFNAFAVTPAPLAPALMEEFPEVESATHIDSDGQVLVTANNQSFIEDNWLWGNSETFNVFTIPLLAGDPKTALENKFTVVISEEMAKKYFGDENPVGQELIFKNEDSFTITGVMENMPRNAHFYGDFLASFFSQANAERNMEYWGNSSYHTYILLREGHDHKELEAKYPAFEESKYKDFSWWKKEEQTDYWAHIKLTDIHLKSNTTFNIKPVSDIRYIYMFSAIGLFILMIACVNYMNLSTARSIKRAREVGIRKVVGAMRTQLIRQFLGESLLIVYTALAAAMLIAYLMMPQFNTLVERQLETNLVQNWQFFAFVAGVGTFVGLLSGSYPAMMISRFQPVTMLKGSFSGYRRGVAMRNVLVVFQFAISIILIISTIIISDQIEYIRTKKLGFNRDHVVVLRMNDKALRDNREVFKEELGRLPGVVSVASGSSLPMRISSRTTRKYEGMSDPDKPARLYTSPIDYNYLDLFDMKIVQGRNFSPEFASDSSAVIINEKAVEVLGWEDPIGKWIANGRDRKFTVIGVVENFQFASMKMAMEPVFFRLVSRYGWTVAIKVKPDDIPATISAIGQTWDKFSSGYPFKYEFMDEQYDRMYKSEIKLGETFTWFALLAIVICCLGLFGLASFTAEQSTKEIGIRKTLGASVSRITGMLCWKFTKWVILSNIIAFPIAFYAMNIWLDNYAHRIEPGLMTFIQSFGAAVVISLLTVSAQTVRAATANPVEALRHE